jgi:hypothetical protein
MTDEAAAEEVQAVIRANWKSVFQVEGLDIPIRPRLMPEISPEVVEAHDWEITSSYTDGGEEDDSEYPEEG